jgi:hypothetical protein
MGEKHQARSQLVDALSLEVGEKKQQRQEERSATGMIKGFLNQCMSFVVNVWSIGSAVNHTKSKDMMKGSVSQSKIQNISKVFNKAKFKPKKGSKSL